MYQRIWLALLLASFVPQGLFLSAGHILLGVSTYHQPKGSVTRVWRGPRTFGGWNSGLVITSMPQLALLFVCRGSGRLVSSQCSPLRLVASSHQLKA
jgi:hypothetical protein